MAVKHPLVGRHVIHAVVVPDRWSGSAVVELQHALGDVFAVEPVCDEIDGKRGRDEPHGAHGLAAPEGQRGECESADDGDGDPDENRHDLIHVGSLGG
jgi:hypothetical protein